MDSAGIIQFFLIFLAILAIIGFAGVMYFLVQNRRNFDELGPVMPEATPGPTLTRSAPAPSPGGIDPGSMGGLEEMLGAISEKHGLTTLTLATADGLLIGSTGPGGEDEAARYSHLYTQGRSHDETGIELLGVPYRGETVIGIARPSERLSGEEMRALEQDLLGALQYWV